jgi:hypothetical protein
MYMNNNSKYFKKFEFFKNGTHGPIFDFVFLEFATRIWWT